MSSVMVMVGPRSRGLLDGGLSTCNHAVLNKRGDGHADDAIDSLRSQCMVANVDWKGVTLLCCYVEWKLMTIK